MANPMTFSAKVGFIRYDEAEEVAGTTVEFAGWGGTTVWYYIPTAVVGKN